MGNSIRNPKSSPTKSIHSLLQSYCLTLCQDLTPTPLQKDDWAVIVGTTTRSHIVNDNQNDNQKVYSTRQARIGDLVQIQDPGKNTTCYKSGISGISGIITQIVNSDDLLKL